jgi:hypothetical protein
MVVLASMKTESKLHSLLCHFLLTLRLLWKEKYKEGVIGMNCVFSETRSGLVIGFRNGLIELRDQTNGQLVCKHIMTD